MHAHHDRIVDPETSANRHRVAHTNQDTIAHVRPAAYRHADADQDAYTDPDPRRAHQHTHKHQDRHAGHPAENPYGHTRCAGHSDPHSDEEIR